MGLLDGKTALITGAARGQGRSHAIRLAGEGARIIAVDIAQQINDIPYALANEGDLEKTRALVEEAGGEILTRQLDVRDLDALKALIAEVGPVDIAVANAGIVYLGTAWEVPQNEWQDTIDVNLTGVWNTLQAVVPGMIELGSGSIILTASVTAEHAQAGLAPYVASKHGVLGLMRAFALELAPHNIRVNTVNPGNVDTPIIDNPPMHRRLRPDLEAPTKEDAAVAFAKMNTMDVPWVDPIDISNAVLWLASDQARFVTGSSITVDAGLLLS